MPWFIRASRSEYRLSGAPSERSDDYSAPRFEGELRAEIRRVIDLMHGALDLPHRPGHASGRYRSDASPWWIATILGREGETYSVLAFNRRNPGLGDCEGRFVSTR